MKKVLLFSCLFLLMTAGLAFSKTKSSIGLYGNMVGNSTGAGGGLGLTFKYDMFPIIGMEWVYLKNSSMVGGSLDWWLVNQPMTGAFSYYIGVGGYGAVTANNSTNTFNFGGRIPVGLQIFPMDPVEVFLEASPMIIFVPTLDWTVSVRLGFRVHI